MTSLPQKPTAVVITITGAPEGTFTATGGLEASGTNFMVTEACGKSRAGVIHCTNTLETSEGTIILLMNCQFQLIQERGVLSVVPELIRICLATVHSL